MSDYDTAFKHIDDFATKWMAESGIPGMVIGITNREETLRVSTYGFADLANKIPVTPETLFEIGSLGKPFTSISILQLCDEGKLDLHKPVQEYLPWFQVQSEYSPITLHHLLNHTGGIVRGTDLAPYGLYESWSLRNTKTTAPPGEYFSYSNIGYKTLGFVLERITGQSLGDVIQSRVMEPLEMTQSYSIVTLETREKEAVGYCGIYDDRPEHISHDLVPALWSEYGTGDGCEISTASDMAKYLRMLLNRGNGPQTRLISEENFKRMTLHGIWTGGDYYGYGLATYPDKGRTYIGHGGGNAGYRSAIVVDMEAGIGVVFLLNRMGETDPVVTAAQYVLTVMSAETRGEEIPLIPPPDISTTVNNAEEYTGIYRSDEDEFFLITENNKLIMRYKDENIILERRTLDSFYVNHPGFELFLIDFVRQDNVVVEALHGSRWYKNEKYNGPKSFEYPETWDCYLGHYRTRNPELSNFRIVLHKDTLALIIPWGTVEPLIPIGDNLFRIGQEPQSPEILKFGSIIDGKSLLAEYSGCPYYRTFTP